jgi:hypothetical protein
MHPTSTPPARPKLITAVARIFTLPANELAFPARFAWRAKRLVRRRPGAS